MSVGEERPDRVTKTQHSTASHTIHHTFTGFRVWFATFTRPGAPRQSWQGAPATPSSRARSGHSAKPHPAPVRRNPQPNPQIDRPGLKKHF